MEIGMGVLVVIPSGRGILSNTLCVGRLLMKAKVVIPSGRGILSNQVPASILPGTTGVVIPSGRGILSNHNYLKQIEKTNRRNPLWSGHSLKRTAGTPFVPQKTCTCRNPLWSGHSLKPIGTV